MRKVIALVLLYIIKGMLWFRYRVKTKGLELINKETLKKPGGILFLPNHPTVFVDPTLVTGAIWTRFPVRPVIVEYMFYIPGVYWLMRFMRALPIPNLSSTSNSIKRKRSEEAIEEVIKALRQGDNFLIYPAGKLKHTAYEAIGGASGVHRIVQEVPEANVVLVRTTGLWGSSFSRALTGKTPPLVGTILHGVKIAFKNLLFFTPRRNVTIEYLPAPANFPYKASRLEFNKYLEEWYNRPDGLSKNSPEYKGESLVLVSYSIWKKELPKIKEIDHVGIGAVKEDEKDIPKDIQQQVKKHIAALAERDPSEINGDMDLSSDLGLDSLDVAEIIAFLSTHYDVKGIKTEDLNNVSKVMSLAAGKIQLQIEKADESDESYQWKTKRLDDGVVSLSEGKTIPEVFLNTCDKLKNEVACVDSSSGILTYRQLKMRITIVANELKKFPDPVLGILLPSSVAANMLILACQMAGKVPVMVNWTLGPRHLDDVVKVSGIKKVLTSWKFIDRLENIEFGVMDDMMVMLEDIARNLTLKDKIVGYIRSRQKTSKTMKTLGTNKLNENDTAVILFTSGTEAMPKGVPLTHKNILSNQRGAVALANIRQSDIIYGILPAFHSFGFTVTGLLPLLAGVRVVYSPDPTDSLHLAQGIKKWGITILCSAPTFLKGILKVAQKGQLNSLRLIVSGAEKASPDLIQLIEKVAGHAGFIEGYGITECSPILTMNIPGKHPRGVGKPLKDIELLIVDPEKLELLPIGAQGLVLASGPNIFAGYLKGTHKDSPFVDVNGKTWYLTGDLGFLDTENNLTLTGRLKRFIKIGGEMVNLSAIEDALLKFAIKQKYPLKEEGPSLAVCADEKSEKPKITLFSTFPIDVRIANTALKESGFSSLIRLSEVKILPEIPIMGTGKVHYRLLEEQYIKRE